MNGWLFVNSFVEIEKFKNLYEFLLKSSLDFDIKLKLVSSDTIMMPVGSDLVIKDRPDFVLFWDKDIYMAKILENLGLKLFNSSESIKICDNKALTALALSEHNITIPKTYLSPKTFENVGYTKMDFLDKIERDLDFPIIIKEAYGSFGEQVYLANSRSDAERIIKNMGYKDFIVQEYISSSAGKDIRINVVGNKVVASMLRYNNDDFRSNITIGGKAEIYEPNNAEIDIAVDSCKALSLDFAGVDVLFGENGKPIICEINSNPNFISTFECTGINLAEHIFKHIKENI